MVKKKVIQLFTKMDEIGGAENIVYTLYCQLKKRGYTSMVSALNDYSEITGQYKIDNNDFIKYEFKNIKKFENSIVVSHHRKLTTKLIILKKIFNYKFQIIHVAHNVFMSKRLITLFPDDIIAVSSAVKENLIDYFHQNEERIVVVYNGLEDEINRVELPKYNIGGDIRILHAGRIVPVKRQVEIVKTLAGRLNPNVHIDFSGKGKDVEKLKSIVENDKNFNYIGFNSNIPQLMKGYHYMLLFSKKEGLGLTLVESCMAGRPIITKGDGECNACGEVCSHNQNGLITNTFEDLVKTLNSIDMVHKEKYYSLCNNSRNIFVNKFKLSKMIDSYCNVIETLG